MRRRNFFGMAAAAVLYGPSALALAKVKEEGNNKLDAPLSQRLASIGCRGCYGIWFFYHDDGTFSIAANPKEKEEGERLWDRRAKNA